MYIRTKKLKKEDYAYLVNSKWNKTKRTSKQQFSGYLGRIYKPEKQFNIKLNSIKRIDSNESYIANTQLQEILKDVIIIDLLNHNLRQNKYIYEGQDYYVDLVKLKVYNKKFNPCVIKMNNGFLCDYTLKNLFNTLPSSTNEVEFGKKLARAFIEAGIEINQELFVLIFDKIYKKEAI